MANYKLLTLNVGGLNKSRKRRQLFRWLHQQQSDIIFLQKTYSSFQTIKMWEAEWGGGGGGKIVSSHGFTHSGGVMILFKPRLDVSFEKIIPDKHGRENAEVNKIKAKLEKISAIKTRGTIIRSRARWYELGEKNSKYFLNHEKKNQRKKHVTSLINDGGMKITSLKEILKEEKTSFQNIYRSSNKDPNLPEFNHFFQAEKVLSAEMAATCEGYITIEECANVLKKMENNKTPGSDGLTVEFYRYFWNVIAKYMVESFNYAFESKHLFPKNKE